MQKVEEKHIDNYSRDRERDRHRSKSGRVCKDRSRKDKDVKSKDRSTYGREKWKQK
jgi:hypothetical protein